MVSIRKEFEKIQLFSNLKNGFILAFGLVLLISYLPIGGWLAQPLSLTQSNENADAIVVLASGATLSGSPGLSGYYRVMHGLELFREKRAKRLIISTGNSPLTGFSESKWVASLTQVVSHPSKGLEIVVDPEIKTSFTEARVISKILKEHNCKKILLVTSGSHIFRASLCYKKLGLKVFPAPTFVGKNIYYERESYFSSYNAVIHEWVGLLYYKILGRI